MDARAASIALVDGDVFFYASHLGMPDAWQSRRSLPLDGTVCQHPVRTGKVVTVRDLRTDPLVSPEVRSDHEGLVAYAGVPLRSGSGQVIGTLAVWSTEPRSWADDELESLEDLASSVLSEIELRRQTERRIRADAELEVQKTYFAELFESAPEAIVVVDHDDVILDVNGEFTRMFGYTVEEAVGSPANDLIAPDELRGEAHDITRRVSRGEPAAIETERRRKDGARLDVSLLCRPVHVSGEASAAYGIYRDITERRRTEKGLRFLAEAGRVLASSLDYEETLRGLARLAVPDVADFCLIDILDETGKIRRVETLHVEPAKAAIAREIAERYPPPIVSQNSSAIALREGESTLLRTVPDTHLERIAVDGDHLALLHSLDVRSVITVPLVARGRTLGAISFHITESQRSYDDEDLTLAEELARVAGLAIDNARLYEEALQAARAKSNFLAIVSHELRTPLTTVIGYADLLMKGIPEALPESVRSYIHRIRTSAWHQASLIEQVLSFSRLEGEREEINPERVEIGRFLRERTTLIAARAREKGFVFDLRVPDAPVWLKTDPSKLSQILLNLLSNALKFTEAGSVRLTFEHDPEGATFRVEDTGSGITPEQMDRIFEPFWQAEDPTTRSAGGIGLGLVIAQRLTRLLGGTLEIQSEPGRGTTATVQLPRNPGPV